MQYLRAQANVGECSRTPVWGRQAGGSAPAPHSHSVVLLEGRFHQARRFSSASGWYRHGTAQHGSHSEGELTQQHLRPARTPYNALGGRVL